MNATYDAVFGCQLAHGRRDRFGYVLWGKRPAHVVTWEAEHGPVPDGKELEHACRRRSCIALIHIEPVTRSENEKRKQWWYRARIERCPRGHRLSDTAMVTPEGGRVCRTCRDDAAKERT